MTPLSSFIVLLLSFAAVRGAANAPIEVEEGVEEDPFQLYVGRQLTKDDVRSITTNRDWKGRPVPGVEQMEQLSQRYPPPNWLAPIQGYDTTWGLAQETVKAGNVPVLMNLQFAFGSGGIQKAPVDKPTERTLLHVAAQYDQPDTAKYILGLDYMAQLQKDVNAQDSPRYGLSRFGRSPRGWSPLHYAVAYGSRGVAEALVEAGCSVNDGELAEASKVYNMMPLPLPCSLQDKPQDSRRQKRIYWEIPARRQIMDIIKAKNTDLYHQDEGSEESGGVECVVCTTKRNVFMRAHPCRHTDTCWSCGTARNVGDMSSSSSTRADVGFKIQKCPMCRTDIQNRERVEVMQSRPPSLARSRARSRSSKRQRDSSMPGGKRTRT